MIRIGVLTAFLTLTGALVFGGTAPVGHLLLALSLPTMAKVFLEHPKWQAVASYRAGQADEASRLFTDNPYNRGTSLAKAGRYAEALEALDLAIFLNPNDVQAKANFALVKAIYTGTEIDPDLSRRTWLREDGPEVAAATGKGQGRAQGMGDEVNVQATALELPTLTRTRDEGLRRVSQVFDAQFMAASRRWLATLEDEPGIYLKERIKAEYKRRVANGTALPDAKDPQ
jgi:Ca-activated chloride channel family protein